MEQNEKARYKKWFPFTTYDLDELNNRDIVFCFHHAGGSASVYRKWTLKKEKINFVCVELPGKGTRRKERFIENFEELVGPLVESIINVADDRNILFFGHSMGAAMAFYAAAYMAQNYGREPRKIVVAGRQAPNEVNLTEFKSYMDDDALIKELIRYQATPKEILQNQELLSFVLPEVRRDYKLNESFIYRGELNNVPDYSVIVTKCQNDEEKEIELQKQRKILSHKVYDHEKWPLFTFQMIESPNSRILNSTNDFVTKVWGNILTKEIITKSVVPDLLKNIDLKQIKILDYAQELCPPDVKGQVYVSESEIMNDRNKTYYKILEHPLYGRMADTGIIGVLTHDGYMEFVVPNCETSVETPDKKEDTHEEEIEKPIVKEIMKIWKEVFEIEDISIQDDFYTLGGDSIILMRLVDEMCKTLGCDVTVDDILQSENISDLANRV